MNAFTSGYFSSHASLEDRLTDLYYRLTGRAEPRLAPRDAETAGRADEYHREFCRQLERAYGKEWPARLRDAAAKGAVPVEKMEDILADEEAALALYEFASSERAAPDDSIVAAIASSFEYGMEFLLTFNTVHGIIPDDRPVSEGLLPVLAASSESFGREPGYVWHHKTLAGIESSLYRIGTNDFRFILHVKKGSAGRRRIKIVIENPGDITAVLDAGYPEKKGNLILNYKGRIDEKTTITLSVYKTAPGDV